MKLRNYISLNKADCFSNTVKGDFYRKKEKIANEKVLMTSSWSQKWPYNAFRKRINFDLGLGIALSKPFVWGGIEGVLHWIHNKDFNGKNAAGCAVTALGQLLYYWRDYPEVKNEFPMVAKMQDYLVYNYTDDKTYTYKYDGEFEDLKSYMKKISSNYTYGKISTPIGSSAIPKESAMSKILKKMRSSVHNRNEEESAKFLYEAIVLNRIPVIVLLQKSSRVDGHFAIVDGWRLKEKHSLNDDKSFLVASEFHINWGWGLGVDRDGGYFEKDKNENYVLDSNGNKTIFVGDWYWYNLSDIIKGSGYSRIHKMFFFAPQSVLTGTDINLNENPCSLDLFAVRSGSKVYYRIKNKGKTKFETIGNISALIKIYYTIQVGEQGIETTTNQINIYLSIEAGKEQSNCINFNYKISSLKNIRVELILKDAWNNTKQYSTVVELKNVKKRDVIELFQIL